MKLLRRFIRANAEMTYPTLRAGSFLSCIALVLTTATVPAQQIAPIDPDRVDAFIDVVARSECRLANAGSEIYLPAAGFPDN